MTPFFDFIEQQIINIYNFFNQVWWLQVFIMVAVFNLVITLIKSLYNNE